MQVLEIQPKDLEESKQALNETKIDPTFRKLSKNAVCFHIWKVEQDRIDPVPKASYGTFTDSCTYIIYASAMAGTYSNLETITREMKSPSNIERFIHFWLGSATTPQKSGNVAYKVMELDTHFGHQTTQYRETQGNESARFLSYFKKGITILSSEAAEASAGAPDSRLYRLKGKKWTTCVEMSSVNWEHFGSSYVMLLQTPKYVFVWIGRSSSATERRNAWDMALNVQEHHGVPEITIVDDGYEQSMSEPRKHEWNNYLSLKNRFVHQIGPTGQCPAVNLKLYKCGYHSGKYRIEELKTTEPEQSDLNDSDVAFIVDGSLSGVWVWVGRRASIQEKVEAMRNARGFVKKKKYPSSTPVIKVMEGHEPVEFTRLFPTWKSMESSASKLSSVLGKLDSLTLLQRPRMAAETQLIDDGTGEKHIFRITDGQYVELPKQKHVAFFAGDCYILHYYIKLSGPNQSPETSGIQSILYLWNGRDTSLEKRQKCDILANDYFVKLGKNSMMVKLVDGMETPHFLQIFNGKFVVFSGQGSEYDKNGLSSLSPAGFILKVFGDSTYNSKAVQQDSLLALSSKDCFVIRTQNVWVWCGQGSTGDAREVAKNIGGLLGEYQLVMETKEPEEFWKSVLDKFVENKTNGFPGSISPVEKSFTNFDKSRAGLYIGYIDHGSIVTKEILAFEQSDLNPEDVFLLDAGSMIFIWLGALCSPQESELWCWVMARDYLQNYPVQRDENTALALIRQEYEPNIFVGFFDSWDPNFWKNHVSFETIRQGSESYVSTAVSLMNAANGESDFDKHQKFPITVLQQEAEALPAGVNPIKKEIHLTHDDFVSIFKMKFSEFDTLPGWRKQELKKRHKLF